MTDKASQALEALKALKQKYIQGLPAKIDEISAAWEKCLSLKEDVDVETTHRLAHSLAGSGATFDQVELGKAAKSLELFIKENIETGKLFSDETVTEIRERIQSFYSHLENVDIDSDMIDKKPKVKVLSQRSMKILVVDDDQEMRQRLVILLEDMGHRVLSANDGNAAIRLYEKHEPDLILMDVVMPELSGDEATKFIKRSSITGFTPIIYVTSLNDMDRLTKLIDEGGDDFLIKPVEPTILAAKISAFVRISDMYKKLDHYQRETEDELETSKHLLNTLLHLDEDELPEWNCWATSPGHFSGDLRLVKKRENGDILVLLCDFTGHGLPAAIGTIFVADLFRSMTKKSFDAKIILDEINEKMHQILPTGRYCAATMISYSAADNRADVWNCGLPTLFMLDNSNKIVERVESGHVPLGVLGGELKYEPSQFDTSNLSNIVLFSDGITEAENHDREMFSEDRLINEIEKVAADQSVYHHIKSEVEQFINGAPLSDDISFIVLKL